MSSEINQPSAWTAHEQLAGMSTVTPDMHRAAMRNLAAGVSILTTRHGDEIAGLTATAVCSVTSDPPRVVVFVNKGAIASGLIWQGGALCINVLTAEQEEVARAFAGMIKGDHGDDRFRFGSWDTLASGAPALEHALVCMDCRVIKVFEESTHNAFVCEILATREGGGGQALVYLNGRFGVLAV
ncbi:flavin reductase family protein [Sphingobium xenophagum]